jgi:exonuclease VII small subunit
MARRDLSRYQTFDDVTGRLDEIVSQVRDRDISLEKSLDLFDEAIALGSKAVELVDNTDFSAAELERLAEVDAAVTTEAAQAADAAEAPRS